MSENHNYSDDDFWDKIKKYAKVIGKEILEIALKLYYSAKDPDTPVWAKTTIFGALAYFISPIDAIPDILPGGYVDDFGILTAAVVAVATYIKDEHVKQAKETVSRWFS